MGQPMGDPAAVPARTGCPDQLVNTRLGVAGSTMSVLSRLLGRDADDELVLEPMRRRHLADVLEIEQVSYPKPWSRNVFHSELELARAGERFYIVARSGAVVVG